MMGTPRSAHPTRQVAVIDMGTSSIRMAIAEINAAGEVRQLETLAQAVNLGKDAFIRSTISKATIEECVRVLKSYRRILKEYQIENPAQVRVYLAGGAAMQIAPHLNPPIEVVDNLVLEGVLALAGVKPPG